MSLYLRSLFLKTASTALVSKSFQPRMSLEYENKQGRLQSLDLSNRSQAGKVRVLDYRKLEELCAAARHLRSPQTRYDVGPLVCGPLTSYTLRHTLTISSLSGSLASNVVDPLST